MNRASLFLESSSTSENAEAYVYLHNMCRWWGGESNQPKIPGGGKFFEAKLFLMMFYILI